MNVTAMGRADRGAPVATIDPRMAERRRSVEAERRGRRRRRLVALAIVVLVAAGGWFATRTSLLDVDRIEVEGAVRQGADEVVEASGVRLGDQLLDLDEGVAASRIEALPWIDRASVTRGLDGSVSVTVTEREPVATVGDPMGGRHLVDASGRLLGPVEGDTAGLTTLEGVEPGAPGETIEGAQGALEAVGALGEGARSRVDAVVAEPDGTIQLRLVPQGVVLLGPPTDLALKAANLTTTLGQVTQVDLESISLLDPTNPVVTRTTS